MEKYVRQSVFGDNVSSWYRHQNHANNVSSCIIWRCVEKYKENEVLETYLSYKQLTLFSWPSKSWIREAFAIDQTQRIHATKCEVATTIIALPKQLP